MNLRVPRVNARLNKVSLALTWLLQAAAKRLLMRELCMVWPMKSQAAAFPLLWGFAL
ncbi:Uncharacterised protein [Serratia fonticola]|uniref:Uncharacterized protein n=1 Tax=Serratia fonticola TaxID=47917 RepID=A0A4U9WK92_SERFO|nr:Uncharacterised protein [Serratia fonticola]